MTTKLNLFDKAISYFSPKKALENSVNRHKFNALSGDYAGASFTKRNLKGFSPRNTDADSAIHGSLNALRARTSDLVRNDPVAEGILTKKTNDVAGMGMRLDAEPDAIILGLSDDKRDDLEQLIQREFELFCSECDITRTNSFGTLQNLALRSTYERGDAFAYLPTNKRKGTIYSTRIQLLEADRVTNPNRSSNTFKLKDGVELDANGAPLYYYVSKYHPGSNTKSYSDNRSWDKIKAYNTATGRRNVIHLFQKKRIGQTRGVTIFAPIVSTLSMMSKMSEAELYKVVIQSYFNVFIESSTGESSLDQSFLPDGESASDDASELKLGMGSVHELDPDTKVSFASPPSTATQFEQYNNTMLKHISMGVGIPFEILTGYFQSSYTAARASMLEAFKNTIIERKWFADMFLRPIYEAFFIEAILLGRIEAPGFFEDPMKRYAYLKSDWIGSARGMIDETKEGIAAYDRIANGVSTHKKETHKLTGQDWETVQRKRKKELDFLDKLGFNAKNNEDIQ